MDTIPDCEQSKDNKKVVSCITGATIIHVVYFDLYDSYIQVIYSNLTFLFCILISFPLFHPNVCSKYGIVFGDAATKESGHIDNGSLFSRAILENEKALGTRLSHLAAENNFSSIGQPLV